jgi:hypothetical protein
MISAPSSAFRPPFWLRLLHYAVALALAPAVTIITILAVFGYFPVARDVLMTHFSVTSDVLTKVLRVIAGMTLIYAIFLPFGLIVGVARKRWFTWKVLAASWLVVLPVLVWLAWDDPLVRQPLTIEEFSPAFPGAEQSYAVLMQYSKQTPSADAKAFSAVKLTIPWGPPIAPDSARWCEWVLQNRTAIEADWAVLAPQRRWLDELNAFDRIGDLTPANPAANLITFEVWRTLAQRASGIATLQALEGHGDEAIATLLPVLEAGRKLQPLSRSLVRSMIGLVAERMAIEAASLVLDRTAISPATRTRLAAALAPENAPALARRLVLADYVQISQTFATLRMGDQYAREYGGRSNLHHLLNFVSPLVLNPHATLNAYGDGIRELAGLAEARELGEFNARAPTFFRNPLQQQPRMKNFGGRLILNTVVPAYGKILETHWKTADLRMALRKRLEKAS